MDVGTEVIIQLGALTAVGRCIFQDKYSDVAIVAGDIIQTLLGTKRVLFSYNVTQGHLVGVLGFPISSDAHNGKPTLTTGFVASTGGGVRAGLPPEAVEWRNQQFFVIDKNMDCGVSGGPVIDTEGTVIGMLCASCSNLSQASWALSAAFMREALDSAIESWDC
jgi:S1-C subfamily serine protease